MKKQLLISLVFILTSYGVYSQTSSTYTVQLAKMFSKDLFEKNGVPFMEPVVRVVNATSNSRFYNSAYVPVKVDKPYFKVGIHSMLGFVSDDMKTYNPEMPTEQFDVNKVGDYIKYNPISNKITFLDTAGLIRYIFLNMMYDGIHGNHKGAVDIPKNASTALGTGNSNFNLPTDTLKMLFKEHPLYNLPFIPQSLRDSVENYLNQFPQQFTLYGGNNLSTVFAAIPQVEIGSLYGTELLLRVIPPMNLGETIGDFAFWGIGLKHSISQYFNKSEVINKDNPVSEYLKPKAGQHDAALQFVYQGTYLNNKIGVTQADLTAYANIFNVNLNYSYALTDYLNLFSGFAYQSISINSEYIYKLSVEIQWQLGLLEKGQHKPTPGYPGDNDPQKTSLTLSENSFKWTIGMNASLGDFDIIADYNLGKFDILSFGLQYRF